MKKYVLRFEDDNCPRLNNKLVAKIDLNWGVDVDCDDDYIFVHKVFTPHSYMLTKNIEEAMIFESKFEAWLYKCDLKSLCDKRLKIRLLEDVEKDIEKDTRIEYLEYENEVLRKK